MKPKILIRIASVLMLIFTLGHSIGHFTRYNTTDIRAINTITSMQMTKIPMEGVDKTYDQFYSGMSLNLSITLITFAVLLWLLSNLVPSNPKIVRKLLIPIFLCVFCFSITGFVYFFPAPTLISCLAALSILTSIFLLRKES
ncbi:LIC_13387 family protein [Leptospira adleri]|uniref:Uncharacterized protein n=1 Tax=Leptospira adleri TaxID=2023186 RepID=A0A2M9YSA8_9LEPT|nr:hypothetical protein [Leptospira adleri]PJZ54390.1 hypothetical protein CH380_04785 [Leptospira adleri]PJZ62785.1 hypothetical protein CH376_06460 [Leptospira adleri]